MYSTHTHAHMHTRSHTDTQIQEHTTLTPTHPPHTPHTHTSRLSLPAGVSGALVAALSLVAVGWTVKKLKLETRGACAVLVLSICGTQLAITAMLPWKCDQTLLAGGQAARDDSDL